MFGSIYIGMSGLVGYSRGLKVIANNTANVNTPGYKSSSLLFSDMFYSGGNASGANTGQNYGNIGNGLNATGTVLSFKQGELRQTGNDLDMAVDGAGLFTLRAENGNVTYTRAGQFQFNSDGTLVDRSSGAKIVGVDTNNGDTEISLAGLRSNPAKVTSVVKFSGNISSASASETVGSVKIFDSVGGEHDLSVKLTNTSATTQGSWRVELLEGTVVVGTGEIVFQNGKPQASSSKVSMNYTPSGMDAISLSLDFSTDVTTSVNSTSINMSSQDGYGVGAMTKVTFDTQGALVVSYSNGQTAMGSHLKLARFDTVDAVEAIGDNQFKPTISESWHTGMAGKSGFGVIQSGVVEISNVDLSQEFGDLIVMQRGYQASSQIVSTANDMLQELFSMKTK